MQSARQSASTFRDGWLPSAWRASGLRGYRSAKSRSSGGAVVHFEGDAPHQADPLIRYTMVTWRK
jgi:hypothetical protein